jgi:putative DNA primase/helicase
MTNVKRAKEIAKGHWRQLLPQLGVDAKFLTGKHGPCPSCGGKDRFRFSDKNGDGMFYCSVCGSNDGFKLVEMATGQSFRQIADRVSEMLGQPTAPAPRDDSQRLIHKQAIKRIWEASGRPSEGGPVSKYLNKRLGLVWASKSVREFIGKNHNLMVCKIHGPDDLAHNVHLTYIDNDGNRAKVEVSKRIMSGQVPAGSAVRLAPPDIHMGIAEGIETAIAASVMNGMPVWSALNAHNLAKWMPPAMVKSVTIFGDNDASFTGHAAAYSLARRLRLQLKLQVDVRIPEVEGQDWADILAMASKGRGQQ